MDPHPSIQKSSKSNNSFLSQRPPSSCATSARAFFPQDLRFLSASFPLTRVMTGPVRNTPIRKHVQPPRPPNAWILYRSEKIRSLPPLLPGEPRRAQADVSRMISEMWKSETEEERCRYERMAEQKKAEHQQKYPGYRFQPQKKEEKQRLREMMKQEKQNIREARKSRGRPQATSTPTPPFVPPDAQSIIPFYFPEMQYGPAGPSPPLSTAPSPVNTTSSSEADGQVVQTLPNASQPPNTLIDVQTNTSPSSALSFVYASTPGLAFPVPMNVSQPPPSTWVSQETVTHPDRVATAALPSGEWNHHATTGTRILPTPENVAPTADFVSFDLESLPISSSQLWPLGQTDGLDEALHAFLSTTADPSIFHLNNIDVDLLTANPGGEIEVSMGQLPLTFENLLASQNGISIPYFASFDFSNMAGPSSQSLDALSSVNHTNDTPTVAPHTLRLSSGTSDNVSYNADEFLNFDETSFNVISSQSIISAVESPSESQNSTQSDAVDSSASSTSYVPPPGAAYSSTRRVGATWRPPFIGTDTTVDRSPPRPWGVPAN
ncbi:hypothetical protein AX17_005785 [Amanita inopinata Kibby_2008]|nr:hypothetical protein AX17_005785 [Amanita inopinata Kibby_2008]